MSWKKQRQKLNDGHAQICQHEIDHLEWNRNKEKNLFYRRDSSVIYMAGFMDYLNQETRFVMLTTQANESMLCVHDRMPLILEHDQIKKWICDERAVNQLLKQQPVSLERQTEYEQMTLF